MSTILRKTGNALANGTCVVLGATHFVFGTVADIAMEAESQINLKRYGQEKEDTKRERILKTLKTQEHIRDKAIAMRESVLEFRNRFKRPQEELDNNINVNLVLVTGDELHHSLHHSI